MLNKRSLTRAIGLGFLKGHWSGTVEGHSRVAQQPVVGVACYSEKLSCKAKIDLKVVRWGLRQAQYWADPICAP